MSTVNIATLSIRLPDAVLARIREIVGQHDETATSFVERAVGKFVREVKSGKLDIRKPARYWWFGSSRTMWTVRIPAALKAEVESLEFKLCSSMTNWILMAAIREIEAYDAAGKTEATKTT